MSEKQYTKRSGDDVMRAIAEASLDALITIDASGLVVEFGPSAEDIFGYKRIDVLGKDIAEIIILPALRQAHHDGMKKYFATGRGPVLRKRIEVPAVRADGTEFPAELTVVPIELEGKEFFTAFVRDISERKQKESELEAAKRNAELASEAKSRFLAHMSHEIRSPLNVVLGALELLKGSALDGEQLEQVELAHHWGLSLSQQLANVLDFSRIESDTLVSNPSVVDLRGLLEGLHAGCDSLAKGSGLTTVLQLPDRQLPAVYTDGQMLRQIISNLLNNAVAYTKRGGVTLQLRVDAQTDTDLSFCIAVQDTGPGLSADEMSEVFDEFKRGDGVLAGGAGLGLAICKRLAAALGGKLQVQSVVGDGSCFSLVLTAPISATQVETEQKLDLELLRDKRVLLVEDTAANRQVIGAMLHKAGVVVEFAEDGVSAVAIADRVQLDIILMDIRLPKLDGLQATAKIRQLTSQNAAIPIIGLSANAFEEDRTACLAAGMNAFISKPVTYATLVTTLTKYASLPAKVNIEPMSEACSDDIKTLDEVVLRQLANEVGSPVVVATAGAVLKDFETRGAVLRKALVEADFVVIAQQAHAMKSACAALGLKRLATRLADVELLAREERAFDMQAFEAEFDSAVGQASAALAEFLKDLSS
jgi:PAS domain S-box-containing protein